MTKHLDVEPVLQRVEGQRLGVEVADGHTIKYTTTGDVMLSMQDDNGDKFSAILKDVMYIPGLSHQLFSITKFARHGHKALIQNNGIVLYFQNHAASITLSPLSGSNTVVADIHIHNNDNCNGYLPIPSARQRDHTTSKKRLSLGTAT